MTESSNERSKSSTGAAADPVITFGSLFAGIGGFDLGFERAGMVCKWQVEIDDYANRVLAKHWPNVHRERDILQCGGHNLEPVDVICGGFPCQDISYAGRGAGLDGERSGLFFEAVRVVRELRPGCVVLENVAALLARGLDRVLGTLAEIGYNAEWHCIPAAAVGAPHIRDRVFVIGIRSDSIRKRTRNRPQANCGQARKCARTPEPATIRQVYWPSRSGRPKPVCEDVADTNSNNGQWRCSALQMGRQWITGKAPVNGDTRGTQWATEPDVGRVAYGVPALVDRLRGLGNAVVPQVAEFVAREFVLPMFQSEDAECT